MRELRLEIPELDLDDELEGLLREADLLAPEPAHVVGDGDGTLEGIVELSAGLASFIPRPTGFVRPPVLFLQHGARDLAIGLAIAGLLARLMLSADLPVPVAMLPALLAALAAPVVSHFREVSRQAPRYAQAPSSALGIMLLPDTLVFRHEGAISVIPRDRVVDFYTSVERRARGLAFSLRPAYYYQVPDGMTQHLAYVEFHDGEQRRRFHYDAISYRRHADADYDFQASVTDLALLEAQEAELRAWLREDDNV